MMIETNRVTSRNDRAHSYVPVRRSSAIVMAEVVVVARGSLGRGDRTVQLGFRGGKERNERNVLPSGPCEPSLSSPPSLPLSSSNTFSSRDEILFRITFSFIHFSDSQRICKKKKEQKKKKKYINRM